MKKRLLSITLGALLLQSACSEKETPFFGSDDGAAASGSDSGGNAGEPTGGASGASTGGANTGGVSTGGASTGGTDTGGTSTGGGAGAAGDNGGSNAGGRSGAGGSASGMAGGGRSGAGGSMSGAGGRSGAAGMSGAAGVLAGSGGAAGGAAGAGGTGIAGMAGQAGKAGSAGSAGSSGQVLVRPGSLRATAAENTVARAPAVQGQDGLLLAHLVYDATDTTSSAPDLGFELVTTATRATGNIIVTRIYWKIAAGPAGQTTTEAASYAITNSGGRYQDLLLFAVYGYDPADPIAASTTASGAGAAMSVPGVGVLRPGSLGVWWKTGYSFGTSLDPTGFTVLSQDQDGVNDILWRVFGMGPTGPITATQQASDSWTNVFALVQPR